MPPATFSHYGGDCELEISNNPGYFKALTRFRNRELQYLKDHHILEQQRAESWQAVWAPQDTSTDRLDPYTLRVIGKQEITKVINNAVVRETKQLQLTIKLVADPAGRNDANRRMGFLIAAIDYKELGSS